MAAERIQGRYSPGAAPGTAPAPAPFDGVPARRVSVRARLLYLLSIPMLVAGILEIFRGNSAGMVTELGAFALLFLGAHLVNEGQRAEEAFAARRVARPPSFPRKIAGAVALGLGVALGAWAGAAFAPAGAAAFGLAAIAAALASFGLDPMASKGLAGPENIDGRRAAEAIDRAEAVLAEILTAARRPRDRALETRMERFAQSARQVFRAVEEDPRDLDRARRFLGVYLTSVRDATVAYAGLAERGGQPKAKADFEALIDDLEAGFGRLREDLKKDDTAQLDVEIEVLRTRLKQEGLG